MATTPGDWSPDIRLCDLPPPQQSLKVQVGGQLWSYQFAGWSTHTRPRVVAGNITVNAEPQAADVSPWTVQVIVTQGSAAVKASGSRANKHARMPEADLGPCRGRLRLICAAPTVPRGELHDRTGMRFH